MGTKLSKPAPSLMSKPSNTTVGIGELGVEKGLWAGNEAAIQWAKMVKGIKVEREFVELQQIPNCSKTMRFVRKLQNIDIDVYLSHLPVGDDSQVEGFWSQVIENKIKAIHLFPDRSWSEISFIPIEEGRERYIGKTMLLTRKIARNCDDYTADGLESGDFSIDQFVAEPLGPGDAESRFVNIFVHKWGSSDGPCSSGRVLHFINYLKTQLQEDNFPFLLISNMNRAPATFFLTILLIIDELDQGKVPDIREMTQKLQKQFSGCFSFFEYYCYIWIVVMEYIVQRTADCDGAEGVLHSWERLTDQVCELFQKRRKAPTA